MIYTINKKSFGDLKVGAFFVFLGEEHLHIKTGKHRQVDLHVNNKELRQAFEDEPVIELTPAFNITEENITYTVADVPTFGVFCNMEGEMLLKLGQCPKTTITPIERGPKVICNVADVHQPIQYFYPSIEDYKNDKKVQKNQQRDDGPWKPGDTFNLYGSFTNTLLSTFYVLQDGTAVSLITHTEKTFFLPGSIADLKLIGGNLRRCNVEINLKAKAH